MTSLTLRILSTNSIRNDQPMLAVTRSLGMERRSGNQPYEVNKTSIETALRRCSSWRRALQVPMTNLTCWTSLRNGSTWRIEIGTRQRVRSKSIRW